MTEDEKRRDACRNGAIRWTVIVEKAQVNFFKNYALKNNARITDLIGEAFDEYIAKLKTSERRD